MTGLDLLQFKNAITNSLADWWLSNQLLIPPQWSAAAANILSFFVRVNTAKTPRWSAASLAPSVSAVIFNPLNQVSEHFSVKVQCYRVEMRVTNSYETPSSH